MKKAFMKQTSNFPRILIIDWIKTGSISATGQMKKNLFADWPSHLWMQIYCDGPQDTKFRILSLKKTNNECFDEESIILECKDFNPDLIYYRIAVDNINFYNFAYKLIEQLGKPLVTHIVDDWPNRLRSEKPNLYSQIDDSLRSLLKQSAVRLSISKHMSKAFQKRYGANFVPIANCVNRRDWEFEKQKSCFKEPMSSDPFIIRYVGALADDMNFSSIRDIVQVLGEINEYLPVKLEIYTWSLWKNKAIQAFYNVPYVSINESNFSQAGYRSLLMTSNTLIVAYNFDQKSINYVRYSVANKLPECMASGVPVLVYGPREIATVDYAVSTHSVNVVTERDFEKLRVAIQQLIKDSEFRKNLGQKARNFVFEKHSSSKIRQHFYEILKTVAENKSDQANTITAKGQKENHKQTSTNNITMPFSELELLLRFPFLEVKNDKKTIIDVGAHVGSVSKKFAQKGWRVIAFEPEPENLEDLKNNLSQFQEVTIFPKAVSNVEGQLVPFYVSSEHWGIHSLKPFHSTHKPAMEVETIRLDNTLINFNVNYISFLKIDVEGADFLVLQGFDFNKNKPEVVMCEFADERSQQNFGYTYHDVASYMQDRGYKVFVSEWGPIQEYGRKGQKTKAHNFLRCLPYPLDNQPAWGNLIFVRNDRVNEFSKLLGNYLTELGDESNKKGEKTQALSYYKNALQIKTNSSLLHKIGDLLLNQRHLENAKEYYNKAIQLNPEKPWPYRGLGQVLEYQEQHEESIKLYRKALQIKPDYETAKTLLNNVSARPILLNSQRKLKQFKDIHKGERCVIIGNGPSLNKMDLSFLKNETCFGTNRIYLGFEKWGFTPTYYVTVNKLVIEQSVEEILNIPCPKFISNKGIPYIPNQEDIMFIKTLPYHGEPFSSNPLEGINEGSTVTYVAMQLAYYMGFDTVVLIGVDHNFVTKGQPHKEVVSQGEDPNHFHPNYFGKGTKWHLPDLETSEKHYQIANEKFKAEGRTIIDATLDGHCQVFPKKHYKEVFHEYFSSDKTNCYSLKNNNQTYYELVKAAWSMYEKNNLLEMQKFLQKSLDCTPYLEIETVVNWIESFNQFSEHSSKAFDIEHLSNSKEWEQIIDYLFLKLSQ
ncbi:FkbM family methyltransferase [Geitlerinema sp. PCC 9228]|uniref:FkbM family methyltransferase n=1 Tax=Geitlerinema sp. PCC 9228 TaxID=111611 RepID=UPI0008F9DA63|nr:FkbM family methyltransferase [Geitlerinema sp. PCC 9228]